MRLICGVAGLISPLDGYNVADGITALRHRGPDDAGGVLLGERGQIQLGHTRLSILDLSNRAKCPMVRGAVTLVYNGELWNYERLRHDLAERGHTFTTTGDTEVVAAALHEWRDGALAKLDGMFAMAWWDSRDQSLYLARDRCGEIPLHVALVRPAPTTRGALVAAAVAFASELKALLAMVGPHASMLWVEPGEVWRLREDGLRGVSWRRRFYYEVPVAKNVLSDDWNTLEASGVLRSFIDLGCRERQIADVPVCTLLSGGIDSSAIAYHLRDYVDDLVAFTAVMDESSPDARNARLVARELGLELVEVKIPVPTAADLERVVRLIEMPHKAQVEIAWACLHLARRMRDLGFKVVFSGEGADELFASYGFAWHALSAGEDWGAYRRKLFWDQHRKNFARTNKIFMAAGVEARLPFLHRPLVEFVLNLPARVCYDKRPTEKVLMKQAYRGRLPDPVIARAKMAFQDGTGQKRAIAEVVENPQQLYRAAFKREFA